MHSSNWENMLELPRDMKRSSYVNHFFIPCYWQVPPMLLLTFGGQGVNFVEHDSSFSEEEKKQSRVLKAACNLNNAACKLKLKNYKEAEKLCTKVFR